MHTPVHDALVQLRRFTVHGKMLSNLEQRCVFKGFSGKNSYNLVSHQIHVAAIITIQTMKKEIKKKKARLRLSIRGSWARGMASGWLTLSMLAGRV